MALPDSQLATRNSQLFVPPLPPSKRYRRILIWLFVAAAMAAVAARAQFSGDLSALMPDSDPALKRQLDFFAERGATQVMAVEAWSDAADGTEDAIHVLGRLAEAVRELGVRPIYQGDAGAVARFADTVYAHLPALLSDEQLGTVRARMRDGELKAWLRAVKERASRPEDQLAATAAREDVLAVAGLVMDSLRSHLPSGSSSGDVVIHVDGAHCLLLLDVPFSPNDLDRTDALMESCALVANSAPVGVHLEPVGSYRHFHDNFQSIRTAMVTSLPVSLLIIALVLYSLLRNWRAVAALHAPAILAFAGATAALALIYDSVPLIMLGFGAGFIGVAIENAIHMTLALQMGEEKLVKSPLTMSFLTTAVAFAVLAFSAMPALRCLGIQVVAGLLIALAASLWLLPALVQRRTPGGPERSPETTAPRPASPTMEPSVPAKLVWDHWSPLSTRLIRWSEGPAWGRVTLATLVSAMLIPGMFALPSLGHQGLQWVDDLKKMDGSTAETWRALDNFLSRWGGFETSDFLVCEQAGLDDALDKVRHARLDLGLHASAVEQLLPSSTEQARRLQAWNALWREEAEPFAKRLAAVCKDTGMRPTAFDASLRRYQAVERVEDVGPETWSDTPAANLFSGLIQKTEKGWRVATPLDEHNAEQVRQDEAKVNAASDDSVWLASRAGMARSLVSVMRDDLSARGLTMLAAMAALIVIMVRRARHSLAILVPPLLALAWTFGLLGWMNVPMTPFSIMTAAFVAGIGLDTAIFLAQSERRANALSPGLACALTTMIGVGSMITSSNPLLADVGLAVCIGMVSCVVACLLLTPVISGQRSRGT
jgi:predicted exporter